MANKNSATCLSHPFVQERLGQLRARPANPTFRNCVKDLCRCLTYEATKDFALQEETIEGFAGKVQIKKFKHKSPTAVPILRAGFGMLDGFFDIFPDAGVSSVGLFRNEETLEPVCYYNKLVGDIAERTAFILDPILATGGSVLATIDLLKKAGCKNIYALFIIASAAGIDIVLKQHPDIKIFTCSIDPILNDHGYVLPGLGDAGDFIFGT